MELSVLKNLRIAFLGQIYTQPMNMENMSVLVALSGTLGMEEIV